MSLPTSIRRISTSLTVCLLALPAWAAEELETGDTATDRIPVYTVIPDYPRVARRDRIEGEVQVCFEIDRKGRTRRISVRRSTHRVFEKPARRAVKQSIYAPLAKDAEVPAIKACRTFRFSLEPVVTEQGGPSRAEQ